MEEKEVDVWRDEKFMRGREGGGGEREREREREREGE